MQIRIRIPPRGSQLQNIGVRANTPPGPPMSIAAGAHIRQRRRSLRTKGALLKSRLHRRLLTYANRHKPVRAHLYGRSVRKAAQLAPCNGRRTRLRHFAPTRQFWPGEGVVRRCQAQVRIRLQRSRPRRPRRPLGRQIPATKWQNTRLPQRVLVMAESSPCKPALSRCGREADKARSRRNRSGRFATTEAAHSAAPAVTDSHSA